MRALAEYPLRGKREAIIVVLVCSMMALIIPILGVVNSVVVAVVSLRAGVNIGLMLSAISSAVIAAGVLIFGVLPEQSKGEEAFAIVQWMISLLALVALCGVLRYTRSLKFSMLSALGVSVAVIVGFRLFVSDTVAWWQHSAFKEVYNQIVENILAQQSMVNHQMMESLSANLLGFFVATFLASLFIHLFFARGWQAALFNPGGFAEEFSQLAYGRNSALFTVVCFILAVVLKAENFVGFVCLASLVLMGTMYTIYGIAVLTGILKSKGVHLGKFFGGCLLALLIGGAIIPTVVLSIILIILVFAFAMLGLIDTFANFRKKIAHKADL